MYQGKFDAKAKGQESPAETLDNILSARQADMARRAAKKAAKNGDAPAPKAPAAPAKRPAPKPVELSKPQAATEKLPRQAATEKLPKPAPKAPAEKPVKPAAPAKTRTESHAEPPAKKRGPRTGGVIFYTFYFLMIFAFVVGVFFTLNWLNGWLKAYEAAQPTVKCQQVFDQLFGTPDWAQLYRLAGDPQSTGTNKYDTEFEGVNQYVAYMTQKVGDQKLTFVETSAGLSGNKRYLVRLGSEKIAAFTLLGHGESVIDIPDWKMGEVELFIERNYSITLCKMENHLAYVNGSPLNEDYTVQYTSTKAGAQVAAEYQVRSSTQLVTGLLIAPEVTVCDQTGAPIEVRFNPGSGMYEEQLPAIAMADDEREAIFGALEALGNFTLNPSGGRAALSKFFDPNGQAYKDIISTAQDMTWNKNKDRTFDGHEILSYTKYSATTFAVRATVTMHTYQLIVGSGDQYEPLDRVVVQTMYFTNKNGKWLCTEMTNEDLSAPVAEVRLTFCDLNDNVLSSAFYSNTAASLVAPVPEAPAGKVFTGWARIDVDANGKKTWNIMFKPDADGNVILNPDHPLQPMTLYPLFTAAT